VLAAGIAACAFAVLILLGMERRTISSYRPELDELPGVPADVVERAGLSAFTLARADAAQLAGRLGVDVTSAREWIETARLATLRGIGGRHVSLLHQAGIASVDALARADARELVSRLEAITGDDIVDARVRVWVRGARDAQHAEGAEPGSP
jgi:hypothetical protein